jgi:predicted N-acetyltransferase YhbS
MNIHVEETTDAQKIQSAYAVHRYAFDRNRKAYVVNQRARPIKSDSTIDKRYFVAMLDGVIVGLVTCWTEAGHLHVGDVAVSPQQQGTGIGRVLFDKLRETCVELNLNRIEARTIREAGAVPFYERLGFKQVASGIATWCSAPDGSPVHEVVLQYNL